MLSTAALFIASLSGATADAPLARWTDTCRFGAHSVSVLFESQSGDAYEDDLKATLTRDDGVALELPIAPALYKPRGLLLNVKNRCADMAAVDVGEDRVLLLLANDGRPTWDTLDAVLIDSHAMTMRDAKINLGPIKGFDGLIVLRRVGPAAFEVRLIRETLKDSGCDCAASDIEDWRRVEVVDDTIRSAWAR